MNREGEKDIFLEAPRARKRGAKFFIVVAIALLVLAWSFQGARLSPAELIQGIPQIAVTVGRMLPPDFSRVTDAKSYFFPENLSLTELLLPLRLTESQACIKQRCLYFSFFFTVMGATL